MNSTTATMDDTILPPLPSKDTRHHEGIMAPVTPTDGATSTRRCTACVIGSPSHRFFRSLVVLPVPLMSMLWILMVFLSGGGLRSYRWMIGGNAIFFVAADTVTSSGRAVFRRLEGGSSYGDAIAGCLAQPSTNNISWDLAVIMNSEENVTANAEAGGSSYRLNMAKGNFEPTTNAYRAFGVNAIIGHFNWIEGSPTSMCHSSDVPFCSSNLTGIRRIYDTIVSTSEGQWQDASAGSMVPKAMCKKELRSAVYDKLRYRLVGATASWENARIGCGLEKFRNQRGRLAQVDTAAKRDFLLQTFGSTVASFWVDGTDTYTSLGQWNYPSAFFQGVFYQYASPGSGTCLYNECPWSVRPQGTNLCAKLDNVSGLIAASCGVASWYLCEFYDASADFWYDRLTGAIGNEQHNHATWLTIIDSWPSIPALGKIRMATPDSNDGVAGCYHTQPGNTTTGEISTLLFVNMLPLTAAGDWAYDLGADGLQQEYFLPGPPTIDQRALIEMRNNSFVIGTTSTVAGVCWEIFISKVVTVQKTFQAIGNFNYKNAVTYCQGRVVNGIPGKVINALDDDSRGVVVHHQNLFEAVPLNINLHAVGNVWIHSTWDRAVVQYDATSSSCITYPCRWNGTQLPLFDNLNTSCAFMVHPTKQWQQVSCNDGSSATLWCEWRNDVAYLPGAGTGSGTENIYVYHDERLTWQQATDKCYNTLYNGLRGYLGFFHPLWDLVTNLNYGTDMIVGKATVWQSMKAVDNVTKTFRFITPSIPTYNYSQYYIDPTCQLPDCKWDTGEPAVAGCVVLNTTTMKFAAVDCAQNHTYFCMYKKDQGQFQDGGVGPSIRYEYYSTTLSRSNAAADCASRHGGTGHLAQPRSGEAYATLLQLTTGAAWVGGTDAVTEGIWQWDAGSHMDETFYNLTASSCLLSAAMLPVGFCPMYRPSITVNSSLNCLTVEQYGLTQLDCSKLRPYVCQFDLPYCTSALNCNDHGSCVSVDDFIPQTCSCYATVTDGFYEGARCDRCATTISPAAYSTAGVKYVMNATTHQPVVRPYPHCTLIVMTHTDSITLSVSRSGLITVSALTGSPSLVTMSISSTRSAAAIIQPAPNTSRSQSTSPSRSIVNRTFSFRKTATHNTLSFTVSSSHTVSISSTKTSVETPSRLLDPFAVSLNGPSWWCPAVYPSLSWPPRTFNDSVLLRSNMTAAAASAITTGPGLMLGSYISVFLPESQGTCCGAELQSSPIATSQGGNSTPLMTACYAAFMSCDASGRDGCAVDAAKWRDCVFNYTTCAGLSALRARSVQARPCPWAAMMQYRIEAARSAVSSATSLLSAVAAYNASLLRIECEIAVLNLTVGRLRRAYNAGQRSGGGPSIDNQCLYSVASTSVGFPDSSMSDALRNMRSSVCSYEVLTPVLLATRAFTTSPPGEAPVRPMMTLKLQPTQLEEYCRDCEGNFTNQNLDPLAGCNGVCPPSLPYASVVTHLLHPKLPTGADASCRGASHNLTMCSGEPATAMYFARPSSSMRRRAASTCDVPHPATGDCSCPNGTVPNTFPVVTRASLQDRAHLGYLTLCLPATNGAFIVPDADGSQCFPPMEHNSSCRCPKAATIIMAPVLFANVTAANVAVAAAGTIVVCDVLLTTAVVTPSYSVGVGVAVATVIIGGAAAGSVQAASLISDIDCGNRRHIVPRSAAVPFVIGTAPSGGLLFLLVVIAVSFGCHIIAVLAMLVLKRQLLWKQANCKIAVGDPTPVPPFGVREWLAASCSAVRFPSWTFRVWMVCFQGAMYEGVRLITMYLDAPGVATMSAADMILQPQASDVALSVLGLVWASVFFIVAVAAGLRASWGRKREVQEEQDAVDAERLKDMIHRPASPLHRNSIVPRLINDEQDPPEQDPVPAVNRGAGDNPLSPDGMDPVCRYCGRTLVEQAALAKGHEPTTEFDTEERFLFLVKKYFILYVPEVFEGFPYLLQRIWAEGFWPSANRWNATFSAPYNAFKPELAFFGAFMTPWFQAAFVAGLIAPPADCVIFFTVCAIALFILSAFVIVFRPFRFITDSIQFAIMLCLTGILALSKAFPSSFSPTWYSGAAVTWIILAIAILTLVTTCLYSAGENLVVHPRVKALIRQRVAAEAADRTEITVPPPGGYNTSDSPHRTPTNGNAMVAVPSLSGDGSVGKVCPACGVGTVQGIERSDASFSPVTGGLHSALSLTPSHSQVHLDVGLFASTSSCPGTPRGALINTDMSPSVVQLQVEATDAVPSAAFSNSTSALAASPRSAGGEVNPRMAVRNPSKHSLKVAAKVLLRFRMHHDEEEEEAGEDPASDVVPSSPGQIVVMEV